MGRGFDQGFSPGFGPDQYTTLGPQGVPRPPYGSFAAKPGIKVFVRPYTILGPGGYPRPPLGAFSGKNPGSKVFSEQFTTLGPQGVPRPPLGSFGDKLLFVTVPGGGTDKRKFRMAHGITAAEWAVLLAAIDD